MNTFNGLILTAMFLFIKETGHSQPMQNSMKGAIISGKIEGSTNDTVELSLLSEVNVLMEYKSFVTKTDNQGLFRFAVPPIQQEGARVAIGFRLKGPQPVNGKTTYITGTTNYLVEAGDNIFISVKNKIQKNLDIKYSGKGSAKYECRRKIDSVLERLDFVEKNKELRLYTAENIKGIYNKYDSLMPLGVLNTYKKRVSPLAYQIMKADLIGNVRYRCLIELMNLSSTGINDTEKHKAIEMQNQLFKMAEDTIFGDVRALSMNYLTLLLAKTCYGIPTDYSMKDVYVKLRADFNGVLREQLLVNLLFFGNRFAKAINGDEIDSLRRDAYALIQTPTLKQYVEKTLRKCKGTDALDFSLTDAKGGTVNLHDFKGKVVVIDVWFTGCPGCLGYSERLELFVYKEFKDDSDVVFVSMSGDKDKDRWLKSVKEGKYTREENINVYTNGMSFDHPWMKYYGFSGGPYSLIIDKNGKIFSGNPPTNDMDFLISSIKEAAAQKY